MKLLTLLIGILSTFTSIPGFAQSTLLGFQYRNGRCLNQENQEGLNTGHFGECGQVDGISLPNQLLQPGARFMGAHLRGTDLRRMVAENANFERSDLRMITLSGADLRGSQFREALLDGALLDFGSNLESCNFEGVLARGANFNSATLRRSRWTGARLQGSGFRDADLYLTDFTFADLRDSDLRGADLTAADLFGAQLSGAFFNPFTRLPFDRSEAYRLGMIFTP